MNTTERTPESQPQQPHPAGFNPGEYETGLDCDLDEGDERRFAEHLARGRRILAVDGASCGEDDIPDVDSTEHLPVPRDRFAEAISAILQVAAEAGFAPRDLCFDACALQRSRAFQAGRSRTL